MEFCLERKYSGCNFFLIILRVTRKKYKTSSFTTIYPYDRYRYIIFVIKCFETLNLNAIPFLNLVTITPYNYYYVVIL